MQIALARRLPTLVTQVPEKRLQARFGCDLQMTDDAQRVFRAENIGLRSLKYSGPYRPPAEKHPLTIKLPNVDHPLHITARPVWSRQRAEGYWECGARIEAPTEELRRFDFLFHSLGERQEPIELFWRAFELLESREDVLQLLRHIREYRLPREVTLAASRLRSVLARSEFLWQWAMETIQRTTLSSVSPEWRDEAVRIKMLLAVFFTAVDDVADEIHDGQLLHRILAQLLSGRIDHSHDLKPERQAALGEFKALWHKIRRGVQRLPRYDEFDELFLFDAVTQAHSITHSLLTKPGPDGIGEDEVRFWNIHAFFMFVFADVDLMCSPTFNSSELGGVRQIAMAAQEMCALANWLGTWEREVRSGDFSSGWVGIAIRRGIIDPSAVDGTAPTEELVARIRASDLEPCLMARWEKLWRAVVLRCGQIKSVDVEHYLTGLEDFFQLQMAARGYL